MFSSKVYLNPHAGQIFNAAFKQMWLSSGVTIPNVVRGMARVCTYFKDEHPLMQNPCYATESYVVKSLVLSILFPYTLGSTLSAMWASKPQPQSRVLQMWQSAAICRLQMGLCGS